MENYRNRVKQLADSHSKEVIPNATVAHATVLIENLFSHAKSKVCIFSGQLNKEVYGNSNVFNNAVAFLSKPTSELEILIEDPPADVMENDLVLACIKRGEGAGKCTIKFVQTPQDKEINCHFIIVDGKSWRFEPDKRSAAAIACFDDDIFGKQLDDIFSSMFSRAALLNPQVSN